MLVQLFMLAAGHPTVLLDGYPIGANGDRAFCGSCRRELREGHQATVRAYRKLETNEWDVRRVRCEVCSPSRIEDSTPGAVEILAAGTLVTGAPIGGETGRLHLSGIDVLGYSGPDGETT